MIHPDIIVETVPHGNQRYPTVGDFLTNENGTLEVRISGMSDWRYNRLIAIHEIVEATLCREAGITEASIDAFDMAFAGEGEPGDDPSAPYRRQHLMATAIEKMLAAAMGVDWLAYEAAVNAL